MKVLTLHQPWASLIALGVKTIETRPQKTNVRGRIAIHAASRKADFRAMKTVVGDNLGVWNAWSAAGLVSDDGGTDHMPLGAIVATANLIDCVPIVAHTGEHDDEIYQCIGQPWTLIRQRVIGDDVTSEHIVAQLPYGDFTPGRWAWLLEDTEPLAVPAPFKGGQGWSKSWEPPSTVCPVCGDVCTPTGTVCSVCGDTCTPTGTTCPSSHLAVHMTPEGRRRRERMINTAITALTGDADSSSGSPPTG